MQGGQIPPLNFESRKGGGVYRTISGPRAQTSRPRPLVARCMPVPTMRTYLVARVERSRDLMLWLVQHGG